MFSMLKGAIFDLDGTLVDSLMIWDIIWEKLGKKFLDKDGFRPAAEDDLAVRTMTLKNAMYHIHSVYKMGENGDAVLSAANEIMADFYRNDVLLKDGVAEFLEYCKEQGIKMCIASATAPALLEIAVEHCGIKKYFSDILSCAVIGKGKEEPDVYIAAMESLGTKSDETCVFEDSLVAIRTAVKLGMKTVGIYDKYNYGHEEMEKIATAYIGKGETLCKLIG